MFRWSASGRSPDLDPPIVIRQPQACQGAIVKCCVLAGIERVAYPAGVLTTSAAPTSGRRIHRKQGYATEADPSGGRCHAPHWRVPPFSVLSGCPPDSPRDGGRGVKPQDSMMTARDSSRLHLHADRGCAADGMPPCRFVTPLRLLQSTRLSRSLSRLSAEKPSCRQYEASYLTGD